MVANVHKDHKKKHQDQDPESIWFMKSKIKVYSMYLKNKKRNQFRLYIEEKIQPSHMVSRVKMHISKTPL